MSNEATISPYCMFCGDIVIRSQEHRVCPSCKSLTCQICFNAGNTTCPTCSAPLASSSDQTHSEPGSETSSTKSEPTNEPVQTAPTQATHAQASTSTKNDATRQSTTKQFDPSTQQPTNTTGSPQLTTYSRDSTAWMKFCGNSSPFLGPRLVFGGTTLVLIVILLSIFAFATRH